MADLMDIVQQRTEEMLERNIALIVNRAPAISASFCEDCDAPIPELRRRAYAHNDGHNLKVGSQIFWSGTSGRLFVERRLPFTALQRFEALAAQHRKSSNVQ